jgi:hypothetical protein
MEYLASVAWSALRFRIVNETPIFLKSVQVILTFHQANGLKFIEPSTFEWMKLQDPSWRPPAPWGRGYVDVFPISTPADYPVDWRNVGDDLVVTIDLPELRPHPDWEFDGDAVVLMATGDARESVTVTWTVTADDYDGFCEGPPISVPIEPSDAREATRFAMEASRDS